VLIDLEQENPINTPDIDAMMIDHMMRLMKENDCSPAQYVRYGVADTL
jgi:hypothetical protein